MRDRPRLSVKRVAALGLAMAASSLAALAQPAALPARDAYEAVRAGRLVLIDIRPPSERADTGAPQGAIALDADGAAFEPRLAGIRLDNPGKPIAFIDRTGGRADEVRRRLAARGWRDLASVRDGMLGPGGWLAERLPVSPGR